MKTIRISLTILLVLALSAYMTACGSSAVTSTQAAETSNSDSTQMTETSGNSTQTTEAGGNNTQTIKAGSAAETQTTEGGTKASAANSEKAASYETDADNTHALEADGTDAEYDNIIVNKTGDGEGDEADFYGENAAVFINYIYIC